MLKRQLRQNLVIVFSLFKISSSNSDRDCLSTTKEQSFRTIGKRTCAKETNLSITPQRFSAVLEEVGWLSLADRSSLNRGQPCQLGTAWPLSTRRQASRCGEKTLAKTKARFNLRHRVALSCLSSGLASLPVRSGESRLDGGHLSDESLSLSTGGGVYRQFRCLY